MSLTPRVAEWQRAGAAEQVAGRRIHVFRREGSGPLLLLLHGFPSSSYDWRLLLEHERERSVLAYDCLGFGLSEKPADHDYTLAEQADIAEELVGRHAPGSPVFLVGHDMGTSVATELMARDIDGSARDRRARRAALQRLDDPGRRQPHPRPAAASRPVRAGDGAASSERVFRQQFGSIFSEAHPLSDDEAADQWSLITAGGGHRLGHKLISYMDERERHAERWHGALRDWQRPLSLAWGMVDPVATMNVLDGVRALRPEAPVHWFEDLGHYPQIEDPARLAEALQASLRA